MGKTIVITGGARSGKSAIAEARALALAGGGPVHYIATAEPGDAEMAARIAAHRARRGPQWRTRETPRDLCAALRATDDAPRLVDCLTLWLSNLMLAAPQGETSWRAEAAALAALLPRLAHPVVLVTNEVGGGIVPDNALARAFRDAAGELNQIIAANADEVILAVCGHPLKVA